MPKKNKNIILFVGYSVVRQQLELLRKTQEGKKYRYVVMHDLASPTKIQKETLDSFDIQMYVRFDKPRSIMDALRPYEDELRAVTCRGEFNISLFQKVIPHVAYLRTPTTDSLSWATDKIQMRRRFMAYDKSITPKFKVVTDATQKTIKEIETQLSFPVVVKPASLAASLLVTLAHHPEELQASLQKVFRKISRLNKENRKEKTESKVLVEQFMEGTMYSVDAFVSSRGRVYFCPMVYVKTGRDIGFDDFFAYITRTPTSLTKKSIEDAQYTATQAIYALGLRSTSAHVELLKTEHGWKVIEVGPRIGGFRNTMYDLSYGIDLTLNDFLIRIPKKPIIPKRIKGHTTVMKIFARKEGIITKLSGIKKVKELKTFHSMKVRNKVGDRVYYAKHGGRSVLEVTLFSTDRTKVLADARRIETMVQIETEATIRKAEAKKVHRKGNGQVKKKTVNKKQMTQKKK